MNQMSLLQRISSGYRQRNEAEWALKEIPGRRRTCCASAGSEMYSLSARTRERFLRAEGSLQLTASK